MTKKCSCKAGKTDPKCSACGAKSDVNLDSFHKLNPEAAPKMKTAEHLKISAQASLGQRFMSGAGNALLPAAMVAAPAALLAGATADRGEGVGDTLRTALGTGALALGAGTAHNMLMQKQKGPSPLAHAYQRGMGSTIRTVANQGRENMGLPTVKMPRPPKVASVDSFKIANPYEDPHHAYGQYDREPRDDGTSALNKALLLGAGTLGAAGLHSSLMNARGKILGGGLINAYQKGLGGGIRTTANKLRGHVGMEPVAQPPPAIIGHMQDNAAAAKAYVEDLLENADKHIAAATALGGTAMAANKFHAERMRGTSPASKAYQRFVGEPGEKLVNKGFSGLGRAADWVVKKTAPKQTPAAEAAPPGEAKAASMIYEAGVDAALATYAL